jgi:ATP-dependent helicase/DNAse subunit B
VRQDGSVPIELVTGPANSGKAEVLLGQARAYAARGRVPLLVVPTRADAEHYSRELAGDGVAIGIRVEVFAGLLREMAGRAGVAGPTLDGTAREQAIAALAARAGLDEAPGAVPALADLFAELQVRRVHPARLIGALADWAALDGEDELRSRLGRLYSDYRATLQRLGRCDPEQLAARALDALRERPARWGDTPALFYGFDDLTRLQLDAIHTLAVLPDCPVVVSLAYEAGRTAFAGRAGAYQELAPLAGGNVRTLPPREQHYSPASRGALGHLERSLFEPGAVRLAPGAAVRLLEGGGQRAELELVAAEVAGLLAGGMAAEEIAVMARLDGAGRELLGEVFAAAGIPLSDPAGARFADTALGRALLGALRCLPAEQRVEEGTLGDLLAWLRSPGLLEQPLLADRFELRARRAGVRGAAAARALWEREHWPLERIERLAQAAAAGPLALIERCERELTRLFSAPRLHRAELLGAEELQDASALAAARSALAQLRELARQAPDLAPAGPRALARILSGLEVRQAVRAGAAVTLVDPLALRARRVRALFLCGMQEGVFPLRARPHALLAEEDRARLAITSGLVLERESDPLAAERYLLYAAVSRPEQLLVLSWHAADDDGRPTARSLFVDDVCDLFEQSLVETRARRALGATGWTPSGGAGDGPVAAASPSPAQKLMATPVRSPGPAPLRDERVLADLRERVWSASSLERWLGCPTAWFVQRMLDPRDMEPDAEPLAQGGLAHEVLRATLQGLREQTGSARVGPGSLGRALELVRASLAQSEPLRALSPSPERRAVLLRRLQADLERYLTYAAAREDELEPGELELGFGFAPEDSRGEGATLPALELAGEPAVRVRGRIDRIDRTPAGDAVVIDYKSSRATPAARWQLDGNLQLALYMLAVEKLLGLPVRGGLYQPLSGSSLQARGALQDTIAGQVEAVRTDVLQEQQLRELLDWAAAQAREIVAEAARGELQARPATCAYRGGCMYPSICRCER